ncbi:guanine nucleotide-binding protein subunit gamma 2 isoform X2 [Lactuca sativa]|uniref:guanine nucleotide-binding protein subunit gamma 2 isoform X2 n=1 Tax=Lactuca sativa TaxID=4236 RepID=UPI000CD9FA7C|nr:guanine nucleotide-binding protein subunit gamma 2 isoform X2 [Lactuca sativa]
MQTEGSEVVRSMAADTRGKHRISAALKRLEQEAHSLEEELEQLENMETVSDVCNTIFNDVESRPDPLLPISGLIGDDILVAFSMVTKYSRFRQLGL